MLTVPIWWQNKIPADMNHAQAVMTPINFVTFILSLYLIDSRYLAQRHRRHENSAEGDNWMPWLHWLLFRRRPSPYDWVDSYQGQQPLHSQNTTLRHEVIISHPGDSSSVSIKETSESWFYHTKQKKLFRAEAADAFALRNWVLFALCILAVSVGWMLWRTVVWSTALGKNWIVLASRRHVDDAL